MKESIEKRARLVRDAETPEDLKKHLCPFFEKGNHPDCMMCRKTEADLDECRDYYLERISIIPLDIWDESFDKFIVQNRETVEMEKLIGIGINCDSCYMSDKCPMFKRGFVCGINWGENKPKTPQEYMDYLLGIQYERVKRASTFEKVDGGVPDANLSAEMDRLTDFLSIKDNMGRDRLSINVEASGAPQQGGGILAKLFGGAAQASVGVKTTEALPVADAEYVEVPEEKEKLKVPRKHDKN